METGVQRSLLIQSSILFYFYLFFYFIFYFLGGVFLLSLYSCSCFLFSFFLFFCIDSHPPLSSLLFSRVEDVCVSVTKKLFFFKEMYIIKIPSNKTEAKISGTS